MIKEKKDKKEKKTKNITFFLDYFKLNLN